MPHMSTVGAAHTGDAVSQPQMPIPSPEETDDGRPTEQSRRPDVLTLDFLAGPDGLSRSLPALVEGLNIVKINLFDLRGKTVWSTDPATLGITKGESPLYQAAVSGGIGSKLAKKHDIVDLDGVPRRIDLVETYMPLMESPSGRLIGVMEIYRDVTDDFSIQVLDTKATVLRTTVATMAGLFLVFAGFIVVADILIYRANRRELSVVEGQLGERKRSQGALQRSEEEAKRLAKENSVLAEIGRVVSSSLEINDVYDRVADQVLELIHYDRIVITVVDIEKRTGVASYVRGLDIPGRDAGNSHATEFTITEALDLKRSGIIIESESIGAVPVQYPDEVFYVAAGFRSMIAVPLIANDQVIGTLTMRSTKSRSYTERDLALAERIGTQIAGALSITQLYAQRRKAERALAEQAVELARSNEELQQFAYVASHDLQEPLRMVSSYTQLLAKRYKGKLDSKADEFIFYAADGAARMSGLINDLLSYSRLGTHGGEFEHTHCEDVLERVIANLEGAIEESGAAVTHDPLPALMADPSQLGQLLQNLVGNAIKYRNDRSPQVHIGVERKNADWQFSVRDNGIGIDPQYADRIFIIFQRLHTREEYPGTGIGLGICRKIVERHGGRIWVESQPGEGSTFHFTIPAQGGA